MIVEVPMTTGRGEWNEAFVDRAAVQNRGTSKIVRNLRPQSRNSRFAPVFSGRRITPQSAIEFLTTIWLELLDWGAMVLNSAGRFFASLFGSVTLAIAAIFAALAVVVLIVLEQITKPSEASMLSLISIRTFFGGNRASVSD